MAQGDASDGDLLRIASGDTVEISFTSGPRAGSTWHCRVLEADVWEREGRLGFGGQGAVKFAQSLNWDSPRVARMVELGQDQWGRLVGSVLVGISGPSLGEQLVIAGYSQPRTETHQGDIVIIDWPERRVGVGIGGPLEVDTTAP